MASKSIRFSGPFTTPPPVPGVATSAMTSVARSAVAPNLPIRFQRFLGRSSSKDHPAHVSTLAGPGTKAWYAASYATATVMEVRSSAVVFLSPFGYRHWLVGRPFPPRISASLAVGLPAADLLHRTMTGFPCSALLRCDRCRAPPLPRDRGAHVAELNTPATTAISQRRVLVLDPASTVRGSG